jgi:hypothetical protein
MSPIVVHGELNSLLDEVAAGTILRHLNCAIIAFTKTSAGDMDAVAATFLSNFRNSHSSVFWNLVWHCADIKVSFEFILPGLSVQLSSARDSAVHRLHPVDVDETAAALQAEAVSSPNSDIPTMSLLEFEQDSHKSCTQSSMRRSESGRAPNKPLPVPSGSVISVEAPAKDLPSLPLAAGVAPIEQASLEGSL